MHVCRTIIAKIKAYSRTLPHWHQHSLSCTHVLMCCCVACRCMLDMKGVASVMPRGTTLKGIQSAAALAGSSNQTALKKISPAGSMCQYVPDHQHSHLHNTLLGCGEDKPATLQQLHITMHVQLMSNTCVKLSELSADDTSLRHLHSQTVHVHPGVITQRSNIVFVANPMHFSITISL